MVVKRVYSVVCGIDHSCYYVYHITLCTTGGSAELVEVLLICGANPSIRSKDNKLPMEEAKSRDRQEIALLIQHFKPVKDERTERMGYLEELYDLEPMLSDQTSTGRKGGSVATLSIEDSSTVTSMYDNASVLS